MYRYIGFETQKIHVSRPFINKLETHREMYMIPFSEFIIGGRCRVNGTRSPGVCACVRVRVCICLCRRLQMYECRVCIRSLLLLDSCLPQTISTFMKKCLNIYVFLLFVAQTMCRETKSN